MGMISNMSTLSMLPLRLMGGGNAGLRPFWNRGDRMNQSLGQGISNKLASVPSGARPPAAWVPAYKTGAVASFTQCRVSVSPGLLSVSAGRNMDGSVSIAVSVANALLELIISATGSVSVSTSASANLAGGAFVSGGTSITFTTPSITIGAIIDLVGQAGVVVSPAAVIRALGVLAGNITPFTTLSPENLAAAVIAAAQDNPLHVDAKKMNGQTIYGTGSPADLWRGTP